MPRASFVGAAITVHRLGFWLQAYTGKGIWGPPKDLRGPLRPSSRCGARRQLHLYPDSSGRKSVNELIAEALFPDQKIFVSPLRADLVVRDADQWTPDGKSAHLRAAIEGSLKRLRLNRSDVPNCMCLNPKVSLVDFG